MNLLNELRELEGEMNTYNVISDSELKQERERKRREQQEEKLVEYKRGIIKDLADCIGVFAHRKLTPPEKLDAFAKMLTDVAENANRLAREMEEE